MHAGRATGYKSGTSHYFLLEECKSGDLPLYCWLEQTYPDVSSQVNFLNLPNWDIIHSQEDDERYVVLAQPLTGYTACPPAAVSPS
jgi:hypothetical protein